MPSDRAILAELQRIEGNSNDPDDDDDLSYLLLNFIYKHLTGQGLPRPEILQGWGIPGENPEYDLAQDKLMEILDRAGYDMRDFD